MPALISSSTVSLSSLDCCPIYLIHLHLQSGEQSTFALTHLQTEQSPLQEHLISSLHDLNTSGIVIQTGTHDPDTLVQEKSCWEGTTSCVCLVVIQIPAWFTVRWTCCRSTSLVGGSLSIARSIWQKSPFLFRWLNWKGWFCHTIWQSISLASWNVRLRHPATWRDDQRYTQMSLSRLHQPAKPARPTSYPCHCVSRWSSLPVAGCRRLTCQEAREIDCHIVWQNQPFEFSQRNKKGALLSE